MAGCFGSSKEDKFFERQLYEYLNKQESEQVSDDIEISREDAQLIVDLVGSFPSDWAGVKDKEGYILNDVIHEFDEKRYQKLMQFWNRLHTIILES